MSASSDKKDVSSALIAVFGEVTDATEQIDSIIGLKLKDALKRVSTQIEIELQAAASRIWRELERDDSEALQNIAICKAVLHHGLAEISCSFPDTLNLILRFDADVAVVELEQTEGADSK